MPESWSTLAGSGVDLHLDQEPGVGRRAGLERALRDAIRSGRLAPHTRLPSTRALAADLGLSRGTVSAAFDQLAAEGYLTARRGSGTTVSELAQPSAAARSAAPASPEPRHNLMPGLPDVSLFPVSGWLRASRRAFDGHRADIFSYGHPAGCTQLRTELADYLGRVRGVLAAPEQIVITSGFVQALALLTRVLRARGAAAVAMEDPNHGFHRDVVGRGGLSVIPLPVDDRGARAGVLPTGGVDAVVVTPAHQYPTGATLHPARRHELAGWAQATGGLIIEDDYDGEFRYGRQPVGAMQGMAPGHVVYVGSASKTLGPGLRLAWMVLPGHLAGPVTEEKRLDDFHTGVLGQIAFAEFIAGHGYDKHIRAARLRYRRRRDLLIGRLAQATGAGAQAGVPAGAVRGIAAGLHVLIDLPAGGPGERDVLAAAQQHGVALEVLGPHWHRPGEHPQGLLVGFAAATERAFPVAVEALVRVLRAAGVSFRTGKHDTPVALSSRI
jgi:GntR family transcriptional regulator / MocR family aminotransferase